MEYKKDNNSGNQQYKRQSDNDSQSRSNNSVSFNNTEERGRSERGLSFVFRKSEKLTTALYMVTDIMSEREPMKWKMRETAVELLSGVTLAMSSTPGEKMSALADVLKKIERMISFLEIAHASRMLSEMNASVLKKEYAVLKTSVEYEWTKVFDRDKGMLSEGFFHVHEEMKPEIEHDRSVDTNKDSSMRTTPTEAYKRQNMKELAQRTEIKQSIIPVSVKKEDAVVQLQKYAPIQVHPERMHGVSLPKDNVKEVFSRTVSDDLLPSRGHADGGKSDRRTIILALIKQKPNLGVKDFVKSIPSVSEKTIQRELLAMVAEGVLVKKGERRWSTYSLPNQ
jgi:DNA-binding HxlR family transcriptional regulator